MTKETIKDLLLLACGVYICVASYVITERNEQIARKQAVIEHNFNVYHENDSIQHNYVKLLEQYLGEDYMADVVCESQEYQSYYCE